VELALWHFNLDKTWLDMNQRKQISEKSNLWSQEILLISGLLS
jgi:hypothetical protein